MDRCVQLGGLVRLDSRGGSSGGVDPRDTYASSAATTGLQPAHRAAGGWAPSGGQAAATTDSGTGSGSGTSSSEPAQPLSTTSQATPPDNREAPILLPTPSLPKGGGAVRGLGERFQVGASTGTFSLRVPLPLPPGRAGFGPDLALTYDSGAGNSAFGLGWSVTVPGVARRTDQGVPSYADSSPDLEDNDTFVFAGGEDLVPEPGPGHEQAEDGKHFVVHTYRPRVQAAFARIERWQESSTGEEHWRVTSRDAVVSILGRDGSHRIADPDDPSRVFEWLLQEMNSDRGDLCRYTYVAEDGRGVPRDARHEAGRLERPHAQKYLKRVDYCRAPDPAGGGGDAPAFLFTVIFDYGDHRDDDPHPDPDRTWPAREDAFSTRRPGFEVRTRRRCRRILVFHHFPGPGGLDPEPRLVRSLDLDHDPRPEAAYLVAVTERGYVPGQAPRARSPLRLSYTQPVADPQVHMAEAPTLPAGIDPQRGYWLADLYADGVGGVLSEAGGGWFYARSRGNGRFDPARLLPTRPSGSQLPAGPGAARLIDLEANGALCLVDFAGSAPGSWAPDLAGDFRGSRLEAPAPPDADDAPRWEPHQSFDRLPNVDWDGDPSLRLVDLTGDGRPDVVLFGDELLTMYSSEGRSGFGPPRTARLDRPGVQGPRVAFAGRDDAVVLADMTGDGLLDVVRVRNGSVRYWPNEGHGRFGAPVAMDGAPVFDHPGRFDPQRLRTGDVDGSGTADLLYLDGPRTRLWTNQSGNGFGPPRTIESAPPFDSEATVEVSDLLGTGTACLVWSSPLPDARGNRDAALRYLDLCGGRKPHLLDRIENGIGGITTVDYAPSTRFYLADRSDGRTWATRLPFPVHVVERTVTEDRITGTAYTARFAYRHGYFDAVDREFGGFGRVDRWDTDSFDPSSPINQAPVHTVTWFHTGAWTPDGGDLHERFSAEFWHGDPQAFQFPLSPLPSALSPKERRDARRALRGRPLRVEVYGEDGDPQADVPYSVTDYAYETVPLQTGGTRAVFFVHERESRSYHYERNAADPRVGQTLTLAVDEWGNVGEVAVVGHPRRAPAGPAGPAQAETQVGYTVSTWAHRSDDAVHRIGALVERRSYDVTGLPAPQAGRPYALAALRELCRAAPAVPHETDPASLPDDQPRRRLLTAERRVYWDDALAAALPIGTPGVRALTRETLTAAFTPGLVAAVFGPRGGNAALLTGLGEGDGHYRFEDDLYWAPSGVITYDPAQFFLPTAHTSAFGHTSRVEYDQYALLLAHTFDALPAGRTNTVTVTNHYRTLLPWRITDPNGDGMAVRFDALGRVVATAFQGAAGEGDLLDPASTEVSPADDPTGRVVYADHEFVNHGRPCFTRADAREVHRSALLAPGDPVRRLVAVVYTDGLGREAQTKVMAEPGPAPARDQVSGRLLAGAPAPADPRWVGTGREVRNNKGNTVRQYEPYFAPDDRYDTEAELVEAGVSVTVTYDAPGRVVGVDAPNGTSTRTVFSPWETETWDENDTAHESTWRAARLALPAGDSERRAAELTDEHRETPELAHLDALGRTISTVAVSRRATPGQPAVEHVTRFELDPLGRVLQMTDARGVIGVRSTFDLLGRTIAEHSSATGDSCVLPDAAGRPARSWEGPAGSADEIAVRFGYDENSRPTRRRARVGTAAERTREWHIYGEGHPDAAARRLRGVLWRTYDGAGVAETVRLDFKGNALETSRRLSADWTGDPDWSLLDGVEATAAGLDAASGPLLEPAADTFTAHAAYDAFDRPTRSVHPDGSVIDNGYGVSGLLLTVHVTLPGGQPQPYVTSVDYDERGRRARVAYGNGVIRTLTYDPLTSRLSRVITTRAASPGPPALAAATLQDLTYTYDPVGNVVAMADAAQRDVYFQNAVAQAGATYQYDALYRLIAATGREHAGANPPIVPDELPYPLHSLPHANDLQALRNYRQSYEYDAVGNIQAMVHESGGVVRWRRGYDYDPGSDRLLATSGPGDIPGAFSRTGYAHDPHGRLTRLPHLDALDWDDTHALRHANLGGGGDAWYVYDAAGERIRQVVVRLGGSRDERIYLGGWEIFRKLTAPGAGGVLRTERTTLHVSDGERRIALVEVTTLENGGPPGAVPRVAPRFQLDDQLGSVIVETDERGGALSFESYYPFGQTAYQSGSGVAEVSRRRYRFNGKERDDETGLYFYGARYYLPWLGRWLSPDPAGYADGTNRYAYVANRPVTATDQGGQFLNFVAGAIGAAAGAVIGGAIEAGRQLVTEGKITSWGRVGAAAAGGAVAGGLAGLTVGASLVVQAGAVAVGSVAGGMVTRAINGEPVADPTAMAWDATIGLLTFGLIKGGSAAISAATGAAARSAASGAAARGLRSANMRIAAGEIPPRPPPGPLPPRFGTNQGEFGRQLKWGSQESPAAARARARQITAEKLSELGVTRDVLEKWREFYRYLAHYDPLVNPTAPGRAAFLDELLQRFHPSAADVAAPAAAAAAPAGAQPQPDATESAAGNSPATGVSAAASAGGGAGTSSSASGPIPGLSYDLSTGSMLPGWFLPPAQPPGSTRLPEPPPNRQPAPTSPILEFQF
jgi:RHS repeat-associated protein